ncbi:MAG: SMC-Scp complex subunit ScpB [Verrucomicrobiota bacterium]
MELPRLLEALLFAADKPLPARQLVALLRDAAEAEPGDATGQYATIKESDVHAALDQLRAGYEEAGAGVTLAEVAGGFQLRSNPEAAVWVRLLFEDAKPPRLSQPALETLAIVAYRQPISRAEIEAVRGVAVDGVVATLAERKLIKIAGRSDQPGRPLLYETTPAFLEEFGLKALEELPNADELRRMHLQKQAEAEAQAGQGQLEPAETPDEPPAETSTAPDIASAEEAGPEAFPAPPAEKSA